MLPPPCPGWEGKMPYLAVLVQKEAGKPYDKADR